MFILCACAYKRRYITDCFYTLQCLPFMVYAFHPNQIYHDRSSLELTTWHLTIYIAFSNAWLFDSVILAISFSVHLNVGTTLMYNRSLDGSDVLFNIIMAAFGFISSVCINMIVNLVAKMNEQKRIAHESHVSSMDGMHEGLLILSDATDSDPQQFMFCNKPA